MTTKTESPIATPTDTMPHSRNILYTALIGFDAVAILLQGLWAGVFLEHDGKRDAAGSWIDVHARGGEVALVLTLAATIVAFVKLRSRKDLWLGGIALTVLLLLESYLGGLIRDDSKDTLTAVHVPLAMLVMGLVATLVFRAIRQR